LWAARRATHPYRAARATTSSWATTAGSAERAAWSPAWFRVLR